MIATLRFVFYCFVLNNMMVSMIETLRSNDRNGTDWLFLSIRDYT
jgi:hypothetical protein